MYFAHAWYIESEPCDFVFLTWVDLDLRHQYFLVNYIYSHTQVFFILHQKVTTITKFCAPNNKNLEAILLFFFQEAKTQEKMSKMSLQVKLHYEYVVLVAIKLK